MKTTRQRWVIRVTDADGNDMYLRRGRMPGIGPIVQFRSRRDAEINIELVAPGLDTDAKIVVVRYDQSCE